MSSHFQFKHNHQDFQGQFTYYRVIMGYLIKQYAPYYLERRNVNHTKVNDASLLALICLKMKYQPLGCWRSFYQLFCDVMPDLPMLEYSRFMRRCKDLIPVLQAIRNGLLKRAHYGDIAIIDSLPLPLCKTVRNFRVRLFKDFANVGYNATKRQYYYGFKIHVVTDTRGLIFNYELTPASVHDSTAALEVIEHCPCPYVVGDVGYIGKKLQQQFARHGYELWTPYRSNMRGAKQHNIRILCRLRRHIETCFANLNRQGIESSLARSMNGLQLKIEAIMLVHNLKVMGMLRTSN